MSTQTARQADPSVLGGIVDEIFNQMQSGQEVDIDRLAQDYPEYQDRLRRMIPILKELKTLDWLAENQTPDDDQFHSGGQRLLGDFQIIRQIGRGGMGVVYEARQMSIPRRVALKILPLASLIDPRSLQRFRNEVAAVATLQHPHIVSVYAVGEERGIHYFAMQLIHGQSLAAVINELRERARREESVTGDAISRIVSDMEDATTEIHVSPNRRPGNVELEETVARGRSTTNGARIIDPGYFRNVVGLVQQAASALQHAHDHGIVHRDVKPANLLLDTQGNLFVSDFGLARIETGAGVTMTGDVLGTLRYMSPEQVLANRVVIDHRTDVYSLGVTLYELLTLQPMWSGEDKPAIIRQISFEEPARPQRLNPAIPIDLETIVLKAISKNPNDRYDSAQSFAEDLQRYRDNKSIVARRPTTIKRITKWTQRNPAIMWSAIAVLVIAMISLSVGVVGLSISRTMIQQEKTATQDALDQARKDAAVSAAFKEFVNTDLLGKADPHEEPDRDLTVRAVLDRALQSLDVRFADQPLVEAEIRSTMAIALHHLGRYDEAKLQLIAARQTYDLEFGPRDRRSLEIALFLLWNEHFQGVS